MRNLSLTSLATLCLLVGSCTKPLSEERKIAHERWGHMRNDVLLQLAQDANNAGEFEDARNKLKQIVDGDPGNMEARLLLASVHIERSELTEAEAVLETIFATGDPPARAHYLSGLVAELRGSFGLAADRYRRAWIHQPGHEPFLTATVEALLSAGDTDQARTLLDQSAGFTPTTTALLCLQAEVERADERYQRATFLYERALSTAPDSDGYDVDWIAMQLSALYSRLGRDADVIRLLTPLRERAADHMTDEIGERLAWSHIAVQLPDKAEVLIAQLDPSKCDTATLWLAVAKHYAERGFWHRAGNAVDRALIDQPTSADALMLATVARIQTDDRKEAGVTLARWTAAHPDDPLIEKLRQRYPSIRAAR